MTDSLLFLPGNHLYPIDHLRGFESIPVVMVEDAALCTRRGYHQQKLALLLAAMRDHRDALVDAGFDVAYYTLQQGRDITNVLEAVIEEQRVQELCTFAVTDFNLRRRLQRLCADRDVRWTVVGDPGFLTSPQQFERFVGGRHSVQMAQFYKQQRQRLDVLLDDEGEPAGGRWSFDQDNRKRVTRQQTLPVMSLASRTANAVAVVEEVAQRFAEHPGESAGLWLPTDRAGALSWMHDFIEQRLVGFGTYEDAITTRSATVFHSTLSPLINLGLLTPQEVLDAVLAHAGENKVPINDVEGFVRQLIGWREFMRGVYQQFGERMRHSNTRSQTRRLTHHWHHGTTGIAPLDLAIRQQRALGWTHHINRLMVIANLMNLCEIEPRQVYEYFMCYYIDAYDWVMVPNVFGMGLNCEGGIFASKPYICGSNYLLKMSDIPRGDWCDVVDGLYWRFVHRNREDLARNPRLAAFASGVDRLKPDRKARIFAAAEEFLESCTFEG